MRSPPSSPCQEAPWENDATHRGSANPSQPFPLLTPSTPSSAHASQAPPSPAGTRSSRAPGPQATPPPRHAPPALTPEPPPHPFAFAPCFRGRTPAARLALLAACTPGLPLPEEPPGPTSKSSAVVAIPAGWETRLALDAVSASHAAPQRRRAQDPAPLASSGSRPPRAPRLPHRAQALQESGHEAKPQKAVSCLPAPPAPLPLSPPRTPEVELRAPSWLSGGADVRSEPPATC